MDSQGYCQSSLEYLRWFPLGPGKEEAAYLSIRTHNFSGGHTKSFPLSNLNWIDDLVESIA